MKIYLGADHRGFELKEKIKEFLRAEKHEVVDCGAEVYDEHDDYPDVARKVAEQVVQDAGSRGILLCGSGVGVAVAANKAHGIRAGTVMNADQARAVRSDEDLNVLCLAADFLDISAAEGIARAFLETPFLGEERHARRIAKLE